MRYWRTLFWLSLLCAVCGYYAGKHAADRWYTQWNIEPEFRGRRIVCITYVDIQGNEGPCEIVRIPFGATGHVAYIEDKQ